MLARVIKPDYQVENGLLIHSKTKEMYSWNIGDAFRSPLILPHSVIKVSEQLQWPNPGRTMNSQIVQE
jgi:hypothetical protein